MSVITIQLCVLWFSDNDQLEETDGCGSGESLPCEVDLAGVEEESDVGESSCLTDSGDDVSLSESDDELFVFDSSDEEIDVEVGDDGDDFLDASGSDLLYEGAPLTQTASYLMLFFSLRNLTSLLRAFKG